MGTDERDRHKRSDDLDEVGRHKRTEDGDPDVEAHRHKVSGEGFQEPEDETPDVEAHVHKR
jgi:hypothetical protein